MNLKNTKSKKKAEKKKSFKSPRLKKTSRSDLALRISAAIMACLLLAGGIFVLFGIRRAETRAQIQEGSENTLSDQGLRSRLGLDPILRILSPESQGPAPYAFSPDENHPDVDNSSTSNKAPRNIDASAASDVTLQNIDASAASSKLLQESADSSAEESSSGKADTKVPAVSAEDSGKTTQTAATASAEDSGKTAQTAAAASAEDSGKTAQTAAAASAEDSGKTAQTERKPSDQTASAQTKKSSQDEESSDKDKTTDKNKDTKKDKETKDKETKDRKSEDKKSEDTEKKAKDDRSSLTATQKKYVKAWEETHMRDFPLTTELHDYNWKYLEYDDEGVLQYKGDKNYTVRRGIDVSEFQGSIDWEKVKKAGYDFAFIRAGHRTFHTGSLEKDTRAIKNLTRAEKAGLDVGVYVFSQAITMEEAIEEAELCLDVIKKSGVKVSLPVVYDPEIQIEYDARINYISNRQFSDNAVAFCETIREAGYTPAVYANCSTETDILNMARLENAEIWYADYSGVPESPYRFTFWQYTNLGWVDGIPETETDLNLWFVPKE